MDCSQKLLFFFAISYLVGSFSFAVVLSELFGLPDPRAYGSLNAGTTNVFRVSKFVAALTLCGDLAKSYFVMVLPRAVCSYCNVAVCPYDLSALLLGVVIGHIFSVYNSFSGGKGVACMVGATMAVDPLTAVIGSLAMVVVVIITRYSFLSTLSGLMLMAILLANKFPTGIIVVSYICALVLVIAKHHANIYRFFRKEENKLRF
ncbi:MULTISPECIES: glycerol-3-phosphate acyltransferase [Candidatus Ichthyocystis]|uniref:Glycerol-3-phosphate acyltransferase n=1 Tax=Candidatus Ichthyocystis hellenicum TaxID=1561003 RepID=A0A0S4M190_9BURK|nr:MULTISPECIES: glycerol-3-phosphate acyltransferase [Ichthyocystis]CUT17454.1 glycerol-3-phosphate acyltransferase [Candidatus Ichthyocystis hellenicum]